jgi:hypothetical protein
MTLIKSYIYNEKEISSIIRDTSDNGYLWVSFNQDLNGVCLLKKVSANDVLQTYFNIEIETNNIIKMIIQGSYIFVLLNDDNYIVNKYSLSNPLSTSSSFNNPSGVNQIPVDITSDESNIYILFPGNTSGTNAKICVFSLSGTFSETIDLVGINNASSFSIDSNDNIWVVTDESPAELVRVYDDSGWQIDSNTIIS